MYFTDYRGQTLSRVGIGSTTVKTLESSLNLPYGTTTDADNVYWVDNGVSTTDGTINALPIGWQRTVSPSRDWPEQPQFAGRRRAQRLLDRRWRRERSTKAPLIAAWRGHRSPNAGAAGGHANGIAVDSAYVYWVDDMLGTVSRVPIGGGKAVTLATGRGALGRFVVDARTTST